MRIRPGTTLIGTDGPLGKIHAVIIDPIALKATHVVASIDDAVGSERLMPISHLTGEDDAGAKIDLDRHRFAGLPAFEVPDFIKPSHPLAVEGDELEAHHYWFHPFAQPTGTYTFALHDAVPPGEIEIRRQSPVFDRDNDRVGKVDEFLVDPESGKITHLVVRETHHLLPAEVTVPLSAVEGIADNEVHLSLDKEGMKQLPVVKIQRR